MHKPFAEGTGDETLEPTTKETQTLQFRAEPELKKALVPEARTNSPRFGGKLKTKESAITSAEVDLATSADAFGNKSSVHDELSPHQATEDVREASAQRGASSRKKLVEQEKPPKVNMRSKNSEVDSATFTLQKPPDVPKPKKKKHLAQDDSGQRTGFTFSQNKRNQKVEGHPDQLLPNQYDANYKQHVFQIERETRSNKEPHQRGRKRKMSASPTRSQEKKLRANLIIQDEETEGEFDLAQSLLTLQLKNKTNFKGSRKDSCLQLQDAIEGPVYQQYYVTPAQLCLSPVSKQRTLKIDNLKGVFNQSDRNIHKENIALKASQFAFGSLINNENVSDIANINNDRGDSASEKGEDQKSEDSQLKSVELYDSGLQELDPLELRTSMSMNMNIDNVLKNAIAKAEREEQQEGDGGQQNEEYESLVFGSSIWSTDVPKESKKQFIEAIQKSNVERSVSDHEPHKETQRRANCASMEMMREEENEFDLIQQTIHEETQQHPPGSHQLDLKRSSAIARHNSQTFYEMVSQPTDQYLGSRPQQTLNMTFQNQIQTNSQESNSNRIQNPFQVDTGEEDLIEHDSNSNSIHSGIIDGKQFQQEQPHQAEVGVRNSLTRSLQYDQRCVPRALSYSNYGEAPRAATKQVEPFAAPGNPGDPAYSPTPNPAEQPYAQYFAPNQNQVEQGTPSAHNAPAMSVHSGAHISFPGLPIGAYDPDYPDNASSNFTTHPYSTYDGQVSNQITSLNHRESPNNISQQYQQHNNAAQYGQLQNPNNAGRAHIFINRQINKFMMNPIYKSKQTLNSLQMHRYAGIPWRGNQTANGMNAQIHAMNQMQSNTMNNSNMAMMQPSYAPPLQADSIYEKQGDAGQDGAYAYGSQQIGSVQHAPQPPTANQYADEGRNSQRLQFGQAPSNGYQQSYFARTSGAHGTLENTFNASPKTQPEQETQFLQESKPFYPKNYMNDTQNILTAAGNQIGARQRKAPAIHVPIPIPIMNRAAQSKAKQPKQRASDDVNDSHSKPNMQKQNERSIFMNEYFGGIDLSKKAELDQRMKETTQNLESKLIKAVEINDEDDQDDDEEDDITFDVISGQDQLENKESQERPDSTWNGSSPRRQSINIIDLKNQNLGDVRINFKNLRPTLDKRKNSDAKESINQQENKIKKYEEKIKMKTQRQEVFNKLQKQLAEFKSEMFTGTDQGQSSTQVGAGNSSLSPKRSNALIKNQDSSNLIQGRQTPFKQDAKQYMDKVLNLMTIINEIDGLNNQAELKNKLQMQKFSMLKARAERDELINQLQKAQQQERFKQQDFHMKEKQYQEQLTERDGITQSQTANLETAREQIEFQERQGFELNQRIEILRQENQDLQIRNNQQREDLQQNVNIYTQQINNLEGQKDQLQNTVFNQRNSINQLNQKMESNQSLLNQLKQENKQLVTQLESMSDVINNRNSQKENDDDDFALPLEEQLENANMQIKDLQEYIKKKGLEDVKNNHLRQEHFQKNEQQHKAKYEALQRQYENMEKEKDKMIQQLTNLLNQNKNDVNRELNQTARSIQKRDKDQLNLSTIDATSFCSYEGFRENSEMVAQMCQGCVHKDQTIAQNEQRITDYVSFIKQKNALKQNAYTQTKNQMSGDSKISTQTAALEFSINSSFQPQQQQQINSFSYHQTSPNTSNNSQSMQLKASQQILLNNFLRQIKEYTDNASDQDSDHANKIKEKLDEIANKQRITLFDEEEVPDDRLITPNFIQQIVGVTLELVSDLLQEPVETIIEKTVFTTVKFGMNLVELKELQTTARTERKACHQIIVEIEKLMYEMNSVLASPQIKADAAKEAFAKILGTYLLLPHRLKPIFDSSKKTENILLRALKSQEEIQK